MLHRRGLLGVLTQQKGLWTLTGTLIPSESSTLANYHLSYPHLLIPSPWRFEFSISISEDSLIQTSAPQM
jgi:hypothetical protein